MVSENCFRNHPAFLLLSGGIVQPFGKTEYGYSESVSDRDGCCALQLCWLLTAVGLGVEYLCYTLIPAQSVFSILRSVNVFSYVFSVPLYTQYENINFFSYPVGQRALLLTLLADGVAIFSAGGFAQSAAWAALSVLALFAARRHWCRSQ